MINKRIVLNKQHIIRILVYVVLIFFFFINAGIRLISRNTITLTLWRTSMVLAGLIGLIQIIKRREYKIIGYVFFALISWIFTLLLRSEWHYSLVDFISSISLMGIAYLLVLEWDSIIVFRGLYYGVSVLILFRILVLNSSIRGFLLDGTSYNFISVITLFYLVVYIYVLDKHGEEPSYLDVFLFFVIGILAYGRAGILSAILVLGMTIIIKSYENRKAFWVYLIIVGGMLLTFWKSEKIISYVLESSYFDKFRKLGLETGRVGIWKAFFDSCFKSPVSFISGGNPLKAVFSANLHNSFLQMYTSLGLIFFIVTIILMIRTSAFLFKNGKRWILMGSFVMFVRMFTDKIMFNSYGEIVLFFFLFLAMQRKSGDGIKIRKSVRSLHINSGRY